MKRCSKLVALVVASVAVLIAPSPAEADWDLNAAIENADNPKGKIVEVVNKMPSYWEVGTSVRFVDKYTTSRFKFVGKCTGTAWRCVTIKPGSIAGEATGWHKNGTIIIDIDQARKHGLLGSAKFRKYLVAHELGHNRGLPHSHGNNTMYQYAKRNGSYLPLYFNRDQRATLKKF